MTQECSFEDLYAWVDNVPLSRRKKNISRDFSDAVLIAEILKYYFPRRVDLHNYSTVNSKLSKLKNWETLNKKVLKRLKIPVSESMISDLASATPGAAEELLQIIKDKVESGDKSNDSVSSSDNLKEEFMEEILQSKYQTTLFYSSICKEIDSYSEENVPSYEEIHNALHECQQELTEKEEVISTLHGDVEHLSGLLKLKDQYIADLTSQLKRAQEKSIDCLSYVDHGIFQASN